jgi:hypothetical protein
MKIKQHTRFPRRLLQCPKCLANSLDVETLENGSTRHSCRVMNCAYLMIWKPQVSLILKNKLLEDRNVDTILYKT